MKHPGTFAGLAEKIDYLKWLGITAVELLPVDEFDENDCPFVNPLTGEKLKNFWGYNPISFGAPKAAYAINPERSEPWDEFREMVDAFHRRGIEVFLDVVFNHTAEGDEGGPTYNFRGLDNSLYYMLDDHGRYLNFTGCGNTFNSDHPVVRNYLISCLRNWVAEAEVDGFRFDLASVFGRDHRGNVHGRSAGRQADLRGLPALRHEADRRAVGRGRTLSGRDVSRRGRWSDWNGRYRDDVRRFWRGEPGMTSALATRICGSDDLYHGRGPLHSINFICCHDGFTLYDLVSYNQKHNEANGEGNRDGNDANWSWNCGAEGPTDDPGVNRLRERQVRNLMATLLLSQGVPMILGGRRVPADPERQQQRLVPGQRHELGRLVAEGSERGIPPVRPDDDRLPRWRIRSSGAGRSSRRGRRTAAGDPLARRRARPAGLLLVEPCAGVRPRRPRCCDRPGLIDRDIYVAMNSSRRAARFQDPRFALGPPLAAARRHGAASPRTSTISVGRPPLAVRAFLIILVSHRESDPPG